MTLPTDADLGLLVRGPGEGKFQKEVQLYIVTYVRKFFSPFNANNIPPKKTCRRSHFSVVSSECPNRDPNTG